MAFQVLHDQVHVVGHDHVGIDLDPLLSPHEVQAVHDDPGEEWQREQVSSLHNGGGDEVQMLRIEVGVMMSHWYLTSMAALFLLWRERLAEAGFVIPPCAVGP
jgi:hypothetical protein